MYASVEVDTKFGLTAVYELPGVNEFEGYTTAQVLGGLSALAAIPEGPLIRVHSKCVYGEVFRSLFCECGPQLQQAWDMMGQEGAGILFYLHDHEGRGAGPIAKARGYRFTQTEGLDTFAAYERQGLPDDLREYGQCGRFLRWAGVPRVRLLTNSPDKVQALEPYVSVTPVPSQVGHTAENLGYRRAKAEKHGHTISTK